MLTRGNRREEHSGRRRRRASKHHSTSSRVGPARSAACAADAPAAPKASCAGRKGVYGGASMTPPSRSSEVTEPREAAKRFGSIGTRVRRHLPWPWQK